MNSHTYDLVRGEIEEIDEKIDDSIAHLTWKSPGKLYFLSLSKFIFHTYDIFFNIKNLQT